MPADFSGYKVATGETSSAPKDDALIQAVQDALNNIGDTAQMGFVAGQWLDLSALKQTGATAGQVPVWNGTSFAPGTAGSVKYVKATEKVVNSASKTDLLNGEITVGANVLSSTGLIRVRAGGDFFNNTGASKTFDLELKLGSQVLWDGGASSSLGAGANRRPWGLDMVVQALSATNAQRGGGYFTLGDAATAAITGTGALGTGNTNIYPFLTAATTVNMTGAQALTFSVTLSATDATNLQMRLEHAYVEVTG